MNKFKLITTIFSLQIAFLLLFGSAVYGADNTDKRMLFNEAYKADPVKTYIKSTGVINGNNYMVTTDNLGDVKTDIPKGVYTISVNAIPGVDITGPNIVDVSFDQMPIIFIGLRPGNGAVKLSGILSNVSAGYTTDKPLITVFYDKNGNAKKDKEEKVLPWDGVKITLTKISTSKQYHLFNGWNAVSFPIFPANFTTASGLLLEIARQNGYATTVARWHNGKWEEYIARGNKHFGFDFIINPVEGYFIRNHQDINFTVYGATISSVSERYYQKGYNFVGLILPQTFTAAGLMEEAKKQMAGKDMIKSITRHDSGLLESVVNEKGQVYGTDYPLNDLQGYFLRFNQRSTLKF